jgi:hypothetical protein
MPPKENMAEQVSRVPTQAKDDVLTVVPISVVAEMLGDVVDEGLGHAAVALLTGARSGVLSTVAWSSAHRRIIETVSRHVRRRMRRTGCCGAGRMTPANADTHM